MYFIYFNYYIYLFEDFNNGNFSIINSRLFVIWAS